MNTQEFRKGVGLLLAGCFAMAIGYGERIPVEDERVEIDIGEIHELVLAVNVIEGNLVVIGEDRATVELQFEAIDEEARRFGQPSVDFDPDSGVLRVRISPLMDESDLVARIPSWASVRLDTKDGDIRIEGLSGEIDAKTVDGDIALEAVGGGVTAHSVDGSIEIDLATTSLASPVSLATIDGDITVVVKKGFSADLSVSTIDGEFRSEIEYASKGGKGRSFWGGTNVEGSYGKGGAMLALKTIDGDVEVTVGR